jgi:hypothetical protein
VWTNSPGCRSQTCADHHGEQRVAGDVERHAEEQIRAALVELAAQFAAIDEELKQAVAGRQGHLVDARAHSRR